MSVPYELRYQWNDERQEIDLIALFYIAPEGEIPLSEEKELAVWELLGNECLLSLGCNGDRARIAIRSYIERTTPPAPPKPDWYVEPIREAQQASA